MLLINFCFRLTFKLLFDYNVIKHYFCSMVSILFASMSTGSVESQPSENTLEHRIDKYPEELIGSFLILRQASDRVETIPNSFPSQPKRQLGQRSPLLDSLAVD